MTQFKREMFKDAPAYIHANARKLRQNLTHAELVLWMRLKDKPNGFKFRRQHPISTYIADFYCHVGKLVIEVDGPIHSEEAYLNKDLRRTGELSKMGFRILRFSNGEILNDVENVVAAIMQHLERKHSPLQNEKTFSSGEQENIPCTERENIPSTERENILLRRTRKHSPFRGRRGLSTTVHKLSSTLLPVAANALYLVSNQNLAP